LQLFESKMLTTSLSPCAPAGAAAAMTITAANAPRIHRSFIDFFLPRKNAEIGERLSRRAVARRKINSPRRPQAG
jgi:hypothetical protein